MTTHCKKVEGFMAFNSLMNVSTHSSPPFLERVITWMFQGFHINHKGNVNMFYDVLYSSK